MTKDRKLNDGQPARLRTVPGYLAVVDYIRREISLGRLLPGDRLPAERRLAEQLGVARETLRQALKLLEGSGQIQIERGSNGGAVVQSTAVDDHAFRRELSSRREVLLHLIAYRLEIESSAARLAAEGRTPEHLTAMEVAQQAMVVATNKDEARAADTAFHLAVAEAAGNPFLFRAVEDARAEMFLPVDLATFEFVKDTSHSAHDEVFHAIQLGDGAAAADAMRRHIDRTRTETLQLLEG